MAKVKVRLLKPLNGREIGSEAEYDQKDVSRLVALGGVELIDAAPAAKAEPAKKSKAAKKVKADTVPLNKMEPAPLNKGADASTPPPAGGEASTKDETKG